jgi:hypothetical protein
MEASKVLIKLEIGVCMIIFLLCHQYSIYTSMLVYCTAYGLNVGRDT